MRVFEWIKYIFLLGHMSDYGLASVVRRALASSSQELLGQSEPILVCIHVASVG